MAKVKVRIAVAVDKNGKWCGSGYEGMDEADQHSWQIDDLEPGEARYWVEAELDVPETQTVAGTIAPA